MPSEPIGIFARPFEFDPERWTYLLNKAIQHRPWFSDEVWEDPEWRLQGAANLIVGAATQGKVWEVFKGPELVGIILINEVNYSNSAHCHFLFFDQTLADKRLLCLNIMKWLFDNWNLETLRVEIPGYVHPLVTWVRRKLGFRYETEQRPLQGTDKRLSRRQAELGSRKVRAIKYKGEWYDLSLLSITREEFEEFYARSDRRDKARDASGEDSV